MGLDQLALRYHALVATDRWRFQRRARVLQAMWREERVYPIGEHRGRRGIKVLGSRLAMPWAEETLSNYLTDTVREVLRQEVLDKIKSKGKLYARPRILEDLLSSQPMAFNLFGELQQDLSLATSVFRPLSGGRIAEVTGIEFEYSPGRRDERYLGDNSAFDVYVTYLTAQKRRGLVGIEVKYHENMLGKAARHRPRYDDVAEEMGCFREECASLLKRQPLQQIWRDHMLAGSMLASGDFDDGFFVFLYPGENQLCDRAVKKYMLCLAKTFTFARWTLEDVCISIQRNTSKSWISEFVDRYLNFDKLDAMLGNHG